jgi:hypothetical protein
MKKFSLKKNIIYFASHAYTVALVGIFSVSREKESALDFNHLLVRTGTRCAPNKAIDVKIFQLLFERQQSNYAAKYPHFVVS